ncbi:MAG: hypothetical protein QHI48_09740, partial [Bacteroidota bacterium]|nr:hypothetical protein [Bacteroidota bacterium]
YSTRSLESSVTTPVLILVSYHDGFFNPAAALRQVEGLPPATPRRLVLYPGGHSLPSDESIRLVCSILQEQWLEYWLKDKTVYAPVASLDSAIVLFDGATKHPRVFALRDSAFWLAPPQALPPGLDAGTWYFDGDVLSENPPMTSGQRVINYINLIGSTPVSWRSAPFREAVTLACLPPQAVLHCDGTGTMYQMELQLWDYDPATGQSAPISRGHFQVADNRPGAETLAFEMTPSLYTIAVGHQLEARLHAGIPLIPNLQNSFGNFVVGPPVASSNTLFWNTQQPSHFTIVILKESASPVEPLGRGETMTLGAPWPNPAGTVYGTTATSVRFAYLKGDGPARLEVFDVLGRSMGTPRELPEAVRSGSVTLDISGYAPGIYHAVLTGPRQSALRSFTVIR